MNNFYKVYNLVSSTAKESVLEVTTHGTTGSVCFVGRNTHCRMSQQLYCGDNIQENKVYYIDREILLKNGDTPISDKTLSFMEKKCASTETVLIQYVKDQESGVYFRKLHIETHPVCRDEKIGNLKKAEKEIEELRNTKSVVNAVYRGAYIDKIIYIRANLITFSDVPCTNMENPEELTVDIPISKVVRQTLARVNLFRGKIQVFKKTEAEYWCRISDPWTTWTDIMFPINE